MRSDARDSAQVTQAFPSAGPLAQRRDLALQQLEDDITDRAGHVYVYVVDSARRFQQYGCSPNWQGGVITLCACKHHHRTFGKFAPGRRLWVAGITPSEHHRRHLLYLMLVAHSLQSQVDVWNAVSPDARHEKSASNNRLGDLYEPEDLCLSGNARFDVLNYHEPCEQHVHRNGDKWHFDIKHPGGRPWMLVGDPRFSYVWSKPHVRLDEGNGRLPREPADSPTLDEFFRRLIVEDQ